MVKKQKRATIKKIPLTDEQECDIEDLLNEIEDKAGIEFGISCFNRYTCSCGYKYGDLTGNAEWGVHPKRKCPDCGKVIEAEFVPNIDVSLAEFVKDTLQTQDGKKWKLEQVLLYMDGYWDDNVKTHMFLETVKEIRKRYTIE